MAASSDPSSDDEVSGASSVWSDVDADEHLARVLASDEYLQGRCLMPVPASENGDVPAKDDDGLSHEAGEGTKGTESSSPTLGRRGTLVIHHPKCELHDIPDHPERPARVRAILNALVRDFPDLCTMLAPEAEVEQILRFHSRAHVDEVSRICARSEKLGEAAKARAKDLQRAAAAGGAGTGAWRGRGDAWRSAIVAIDSDTAIMPASREAIFRAAGAACAAVDEVMSGRAHNAFCCVRPPGHHAEPDKAMGFCFFNNAPIGALHAQARHDAQRVAVVDIDVHHGNGTQASFTGDGSTFYASTHQGPNFYPGTGFAHIKGVAGNIVNVSMRGGGGSRGFREAYSGEILPALEAFRPGLIVVSAGFDAHKDDPLAGIELDEEDYEWVTREICAVAQRVCDGRVVSVLEGGYNLQAISQSAVAHVRALREAAAEAAAPMATATATATSSAPMPRKDTTGVGAPSAKDSPRASRSDPASGGHLVSRRVGEGDGAADALLADVHGGGVGHEGGGGPADLGSSDVGESATLPSPKSKDPDILHDGCTPARPPQAFAAGQGTHTIADDQALGAPKIVGESSDEASAYGVTLGWDETAALGEQEIEEIDGLIAQLNLEDEDAPEGCCPSDNPDRAPVAS